MEAIKATLSAANRESITLICSAGETAAACPQVVAAWNIFGKSWIKQTNEKTS